MNELQITKIVDTASLKFKKREEKRKTFQVEINKIIYRVVSMHSHWSRAPDWTHAFELYRSGYAFHIT